MRLFRILRTIRTALKALRRNPMRAALTSLGIIIEQQVEYDEK